jgi:hypothetical protein
MIEHSEIAHYLLSLGLVKPRSVIEEDLTVVDLSRRHCVFLARSGADRVLVVKQAGPKTGDALAHEAAVLRSLAHCREIAGNLPEVIAYEPKNARLVLSTPGGGLV